MSDLIDPETLTELPPRRSFWRMASKIIFAHLVFILIIFVPLAIHENHQAQRDWDDFKAHWEAKGEIFDLEKLIPPEIPDEENFAAAAIIAEIFKHPHNNRLTDLNFSKLPSFSEYPESYDKPANTKQQTLANHKIDLVNYLKDPQKYLTEEEAANHILKALQPWSATLAELSQASFRANARYPIDYDNSTLDSDYSFLSALKTASSTLHLRARASLILNDSDKAGQDILTNLRIANLVGKEPTIISHLYQISICRAALKNIWTGLQTKQFSQELPQLNLLLEQLELKSRLLESLRFNRSTHNRFTQSYIESFCKKHHVAPDLLSASLIYKYIGLSKAFRTRNRLNYSEFYQDHFLSSEGKVNLRWLNLNSVARSKSALHKFKPHPLFGFDPYSSFLRHFEFGLSQMIQTTAQTSTRIDLARIAIALELYRREHGDYPTTLSPLAPSYLATIPNDLITGAPLHYRIKGDSTPIIYSVGLNQIDEGGLLKEDRTQGDWVWQYTLPKNLDEAEWEK